MQLWNRPCGGARRVIAFALPVVLVATTLAGGWAAVPAAAAVPTAVDAKNVAFDIRSTDIVYDPVREVVYAVTDATDPRYPNRIVSIDPATARLTSALTLAASPLRIAIAPDASAVYVATANEVVAYALPGFTAQWSYSAGSGSVFDVSAAPTPGTIAVSVRGGSTAGTFVVDHGTARGTGSEPTDTGYTVFDPSGTRLFMTTSSLISYDVGPDGLTNRRDWGQLTKGRLSILNGRLAGNRNLFDITDGTPVPAGNLGLWAFTHDPVRHEFIGTAQSSRDLAATDLVVMDDTTYAVKAVLEATSSRNGQLTERIVSAGPGRVAFRDTTYIAGPAPVILAWLDPDAGFGSEGEYHPVDPERVLDTRSGLGLPGGMPRRVGPGDTIELQLAGRGSLPSAHIAAVVMNVTAVDPTAPSFLTVYPGDIERPTISNLNVRPGVTVANLVTVPVSATGTVSIYNPFGDVDVLADVAGYYSTDAGPDGLRYSTVSAQRIVDSRVGYGGVTTLGPQSTATFEMGPDARFLNPAIGAVVINLTVTNSTAPTFVTVAPAGGELPTASNVNIGAGRTVANQAIVRLPANRRLQIYNEAGRVDVIIDLVGYYGLPEGGLGESGRFIALEPFRATDTRVDSPYPPPGRLWSGDILYVGDGVVRASAYVLNVTVTDTVGQGFVTAFPFSPMFSTGPPTASTVNYTSGNTVPNHAIVSPGPYLGFYHFGGEAHLVVDVFGAFTLR